MPSAADDNPGGGSARGPPAFFREWKRMHREATRDGGGDDVDDADDPCCQIATYASRDEVDANDEGAAMFAHQVATRSTSLGDPTIERPIAAVDGVGGLNGREMREPASAGRGSAVDREAGPSIPENIGKSLRFGYDAAHHHTGRFVDGAVDVVTQTLATTTLRVAGNLRVLMPLLDTFFEDLDPKTVRLDDRGLEIYAPSKIKQETLTALLGGCCPYGNVRLGPLRIELPLDAVWKSSTSVDT